MLVAELIRRDRVARRYFEAHEALDEEAIGAVFDYMSGDGESSSLPVAAKQLDAAEVLPILKSGRWVF